MITTTVAIISIAKIMVIMIWYDHAPDRVLENEDVKILWDFSIQGECWIIDIACPFDTRMEEKEQEKLDK